MRPCSGAGLRKNYQQFDTYTVTQKTLNALPHNTINFLSPLKHQYRQNLRYIYYTGSTYKYNIYTYTLLYSGVT